MDPLAPSYPWYTPYQFAGNMPIWAVDLDGLEQKIVTHYLDANGKIYDTRVTIISANAVAEGGKYYARTTVVKIYDDSRGSEHYFYDEEVTARVDGILPNTGIYPSARYDYSKHGGYDDFKKQLEDTEKGALAIALYRDTQAPDNEENLERLGDASIAVEAIILPGTTVDAFTNTYSPVTNGGGAYKPKYFGITSNKHRHHVPSKDSYQGTGLSKDRGGAIEMDDFDHVQTASYGSGPRAVAYRSLQSQLIQNGNFKGAFDMDINDIRTKFGSKYDSQIQAVEQYYRSANVPGF